MIPLQYPVSMELLACWLQYLHSLPSGTSLGISKKQSKMLSQMVSRKKFSGKANYFNAKNIGVYFIEFQIVYYHYYL